MPPIGHLHAFAVDELQSLFQDAVRGSARVSGQNPVILDEHSEPQPDLKLLRLRQDRYRDALPGPEDVLLIVEVSDMTVEFDRSVKLPLCAKRGIPEAWIVNLQSERLEVYRGPGANGYATSNELPSDQTISPLALPSVTIEWGKAVR